MSQAAREVEIVSPLPEAARYEAVRAIPLKPKFENFLNRSTSDNTRNTYKRTILEFQAFVSRHLMLVTERDVLAWRDKLLTSDKQADQTVATKLSILRSFYGHLHKLNPELVP